MRGQRFDRRTAVTVAIAAVFLAVALPLVVAAVPGVIGAEGGYVVQSSSMAPAISAGDLIIVDDTSAERIETGDVITFRDGGASSIVTHRVVEVDGSGEQLRFVTKGDANDAPDSEPVRPENVVGTVWFSVPLAGHIVAFANTQIGLLLLVVVPATVLVVTEAWSLYRDADTKIRVK